ncbi:sterol desaturase/sphingolipid hydroxylase (fatty acid hydroxylase superfamily) [Lutibacter sp. Hel_I_33_5]|uniref:sterol desaturase family protein n=1 Tax=Lutibacter sp. Hel_I_33_5 TaxID=1566289 RepID=UPI0011A81004|nr:sterol desaturase family protein [Lutibacter sp. Hel_I_33_5]TVZ56828.1 sterol desaturase/sphingolipid hydroxylase (fatty acid hydroxylase superfamily) [Lutibacter sp. Hel_I_33_5]
MTKYFDIAKESFVGYYNYLINEILNPHWGNYFYWLIAISLIFFFIEILLPWRKKQALFRRDFWLDTFYMFFNFFLFSLIGYNAISNVAVTFFNDNLKAIGIDNLTFFHVEEFPFWSQLLILFLVRDFIQYFIHRLLHKVPFLWNFHKVHHSVKEMGFAAHLRFHWMETVVYRTLEYIPLALIGFGIDDFILVHLFTLTWGHFNHSNTNISLGVFKYIFNNPKMHIWHHSKEIPNKTGVNFGLTLSLWDYLFKTDYIPSDGKNIELGFDDDDVFPQDFIGQEIYPLSKK